jgi:nitric oxide dioxygenase
LTKAVSFFILKDVFFMNLYTGAGKTVLSASAKPFIEASVPVLREHGLAITQTFYRNMLAEHPELKNLFNMGNQAQGLQQQSLASAVFAYAANIDNPAALAPVVSRIVHKHASLGITPDHYPIVGNHLLRAIRETLGDAATQPLIEAWAEAYGVLANALIEEERKLYGRAEINAGEMSEMRVARIRQESDVVKSFELEPVGGGPLKPFIPGQYISVAVDFADGSRQLRQYSLSDAPSKSHYRISIKRESGEVAGQVSNWMHDHLEVGSIVKVGAPFGDFQPKAEAGNPLVLLSAGVGITPMIATLNHLAETQPEQAVIFAHAARSRSAHAHLADIERVQERMSYLKTITFYESLQGISSGEENVTHGRMSVDALPKWDLSKANVYICGPDIFMKTLCDQLRERGVPAGRIHREVFGPALLSDLN